MDIHSPSTLLHHYPVETRVDNLTTKAKEDPQSYLQQMGGTAQQPNQPNQNTAHQDTHGLHWERQYRQFCGIHSLNSLLGSQAITPTDIMDFCKRLHEAYPNSIDLPNMYRPGAGCLTVTFITLMLNHRSTVPCCLKKLSHRTPDGDATQEILKE